MSEEKKDIVEDSFDDGFGDELEVEEKSGAPALAWDEVFPTERPTFDLEEGGSIEFQVMQDFDGEEYAKLSSFQKRLTGTLKVMDKDPKNEQAIKRLNALAKHFVQMVLPDIDPVVIGKMKLGGKLKIITFWNANGGFGEDETEKKEGGGKGRNS